MYFSYPLYIDDVENQLKAVDSHLNCLVEFVRKLDNQTDTEISSEQEKHLNSLEVHRLSSRYKRIKEVLISYNRFYFSDLADFSMPVSINDLAAIQREITYIFSLLKLSKSSNPLMAFNEAERYSVKDPQDNLSFSDAEKSDIQFKLLEIENCIVKKLKESEKWKEKTEEKIHGVSYIISQVKDSLEYLGKKDWNLFAVSSLSSILIDIGSFYLTPHLIEIFRTLFVFLESRKFFKP